MVISDVAEYLFMTDAMICLYLFEEGAMNSQIV